MSEDRSVLDVVENIDRKLDEKSRSDEARFMASEALLRDHEHRLDGHDEKLKEHTEELTTHATMLRDQAVAITNVSNATARAIDVALDAKREASRSVDEATKIVESAIRMHSVSIAATVQSAVKQEVAPIVAEMARVKSSDDTQTTAIADVKKEVGAIKTIVAGIAKTLGHPYLRLLIIVCIALGSLGGAAYAAYTAKQAVDIAAPKTAPALPR